MIAAAPPFVCDPLEWIRSLTALLVNAGRAMLSNRLGGGGTAPVYYGWGTGAGAVAVTDTTLFTEVAADLATTTGTRPAGTASQATTTVTNDTYQVVASRTASAPGTVTNVGLFDNATIGSGALFMKVDGVADTLQANDTLGYTFQLKFS